MKTFDHIDVKTVNEAVTSLKEHNGRAKLIAGGTNLLGTLKDRILPDYPEVILNIKTIPGLDSIVNDDKGLKIGALTKLSAITESPVINTRYRLLTEASKSVGTPQIRNMGTIGGNLCQDLRCWYYRYPHHIGGRVLCYLKGGNNCFAFTGENQHHSIFGGYRASMTPCSSACPGNVDIPSYLSEIREGNLHKAAEILLMTNPLPSITGRVCPHFCEMECNRGEFDEPVSIRDIERFTGDYILENAAEIIRPAENDRRKSVAIVGSGPAGLSAGYYLNRLGYKVTVFESRQTAGGMMRTGIPGYRLPEKVLDGEIEKLRAADIEIKTDHKVESLDELFEQGYEAIFIGTGAHKGLKPGIPGEDSPGVIDCVSFLREVNTRQKVDIGNRVGVIGGGYAALDASRTALRLGAGEITILYRRTCEEMPAGQDEVNDAIEEGVKFEFLTAPVGIVRENNKLKLECIRTQPGALDESGRRYPEPVEGSEFYLELDTLIFAVGQQPEVPAEFELPLSPANHIIVEENGYATGRQGVFAGGDAVSGTASIIEAVAAGREAAYSIDRYLSGDTVEMTTQTNETAHHFTRFSPGCLNTTGRAEIAKVPVVKRTIDTEDAQGLNHDEATAEADRCFNCSCVAVNSSDIAVALMALEAKIEVAGPRGTRKLDIEDFYSSPLTTLSTDEMVTEVIVPQPPYDTKQVFLKFRLREAVDFSIVSVALMLVTENGICKDAAIVLGGVAPCPIRVREGENVIKGKPIDAETVEAASTAAVMNALPLKKNTYKVEITKNLVKKALLS